MNLKMVDEDGNVLAERPLIQKKPKKAVDDGLFDINKVDPDFREMMCDKLISACELIGENPRTGKTKVFDTPIEARAWEKHVERQGFNMIGR